MKIKLEDGTTWEVTDNFVVTEAPSTMLLGAIVRDPEVGKCPVLTLVKLGDCKLQNRIIEIQP